MNGELWTQPIAEAEVTAGTELNISGDTTDQEWLTRVGVAADGTQIYTWFVGSTGATTGVFYKIVDNTGTTVAGPTQIADNNVANQQQQSDIAVDMNGNFVITWTERTGSEYDIHMKVFTAGGSQVGSEIVVSNVVGDERFTRVSLQYETDTTSKAVFAWRDLPYSNPDIYHRLYDITWGTSTIAPYNGGGGGSDFSTGGLIVNTHTTGSQTEHDVAMNPNGEYVITWTGPGPSAGTGWYRIYNETGAAQTPTNTQENIFHTTTSSVSYSSVASSNDRFVIAFQVGTDIYARFVNCQPGISSCVLGISEITVEEGSTSAFAPEVGMDQFGNFVVTYHDTSGLDGGGYGIFAQSVDRNGDLIGSQFQVNTTTANNQVTPTADLGHDGTYAVAWEDQTGGSYSNTMRAQYYVSDLFKNGEEWIALATGDATTQSDIDVDVAANGNTVMVWAESGNIMMTLKDSTGAVINSMQEVDIDGGGTNSNPSVAFYKDSTGSNVGKFIVAWETIILTTKDINSKVFNADGTLDFNNAIDSSTGDQILPDVDTGYYAGIDMAVAWIDTNTNTVRLRTSADWGNIKNVATCTAATACENGVSVSMDPTNDNSIVAYAEYGGSYTNVKVMPYTGGTAGSALSLGGAPGSDDHSPDIKFIKYGASSEYVVTFLIDQPYDPIILSHATFSGTWIISYNVSGVDWLGNDHSQATPKIAADTDNGDILIVWGDLPTTPADDNIWGRFYEYTSGGPGSLSPYGLPIRINSTTVDNQFNPSVGMNTEGDIIVGWEGDWEDDVNEGVDDIAAPVYQRLYNPLNEGIALTFQPEAEQEVLAGTRTVNVPTSIVFPKYQGEPCTEITVDPAASVNTQVDVAVRDTADCNANPAGGSDLAYIE
ncbi:hypothetical protein ACFL2V_21235, partial [Pseudomonadota bacterium]